jgi:hypothetical protein
MFEKKQKLESSPFEKNGRDLQLLLLVSVYVSRCPKLWIKIVAI